MIKFDANEILKYCVKHPKARYRKKNVIYAPKLFFVNSILKNLENKYNSDGETLTEDMLEFYIEYILGYINGLYDISYYEGELIVIPNY